MERSGINLQVLPFHLRYFIERRVSRELERFQAQDEFPEVFDRGTAGGSARAENERRVKKREDRITKRFPRAGKLLDSLAFKYEFQTLHDRLIPKTRTNIDHIAVTKSGIFVIDAKNYKGTVRIKDVSGIFTKSAPEFWVGKRNCMKLVVGMQKQTGVVKEILSHNSIDMPVIGVLAFYLADWETYKFLRKQEEVDGILINSRGLEPIVSRGGSFTATEIDLVVRVLARTLLSAS